MSGQLNIIKHKLAEAITQLCEVSWMFVKNLDKISHEKENSVSKRWFHSFWLWKAAALQQNC